MTEKVVVSAPGKVILHGEHSVVYGKVAVASSLNLRCYLLSTINQDGLIVLDLPDVDVHKTWNVQDVEGDLLPHLQSLPETSSDPKSPSKEDLQHMMKFADLDKGSEETKDRAILTFLHLFCSICGLQYKSQSLPALHVRLVSQLPVRAGLGSSASFSVCLATILLLQAGHIRPLTHAEGHQHGDDRLRSQTWSPDHLHLINQWAFVGEKIIHGQPSGIDNSVSAFGGAIRFQNKKITPIDRMPNLQILLTNTKVPRCTKTIVAGVRTRYNKFPEVMTGVLEAMHSMAEKSIDVYGDLVDAAHPATLYHQLEELVDMNQHLLNAVGAGHPSLDSVVQLTAKHGLHTKLTGAGGGGCAVTLLTPDTPTSTVQEVIKDLQNLGYDCWKTSIGAKGITFHPDPEKDSSIPPSLMA